MCKVVRLDVCSLEFQKRLAFKRRFVIESLQGRLLLGYLVALQARGRAYRFVFIGASVLSEVSFLSICWFVQTCTAER
jgi:hypothetical protein